MPIASSRLYTITAIFVTTLVVSNIIAIKLLDVSDRVFDAGNILFPLTYLIGDVLTEVYGIRVARRVILLGFACNVLAVGAIQAAVHLPAADFWAENDTAFGDTLGTTWRIFVASLAAYFVGELINSALLARLKVVTEGRFLWLRTISSTIVGQGFDTVLFVLIAFAGTGAPLGETILTTWVIKVAWETAATPLTYGVVGYLKRKEELDVYDTDLRLLQPRTLS